MCFRERERERELELERGRLIDEHRAINKARETKRTLAVAASIAIVGQEPRPREVPLAVLVGDRNHGNNRGFSRHPAHRTITAHMHSIQPHHIVTSQSQHTATSQCHITDTAHSTQPQPQPTAHSPQPTAHSPQHRTWSAIAITVRVEFPWRWLW